MKCKKEECKIDLTYWAQKETGFCSLQHLQEHGNRKRNWK